MLGAIYDAVKLSVLKVFVLVDFVKRRIWPVEPRIIEEGPGTQQTKRGNVLCVFAHFDRDGIVDDYVVHYLRALDELDCEIVFVSTAEDMADAEIEKISPFCRWYIVKQNIGYDFASWRTGLETVTDFSGYDRIILANDSVYGPLQDLNGIFDEMGRRHLDFWGITDSLRYGRHLQSYFMVFEKPVIESATFRSFWRNLPDYRNKHVIITQGEVGLSHRLTAAGFHFAAYNPVEQVFSSLFREKAGWVTKIRGRRFNSTHIGWSVLLRAGCPFIKVQLLRDNPKGVGDVAEWEHVVTGISGRDAGLIRRHLERLSGRA